MKADPTRFINASQLGGIDSYIINDGDGRGVRALCVNTGAGLRYRILIDRGLDIDQAFLNAHSLAFLTHKGVTAPTRALDRGFDWLKGFPGGLLTSCGPFNIGGPCTDNGEELGLHGSHSNSAAEIESVVCPDPRAGKMDMSVTGKVRYGALYGPCVEMRRTIKSSLGTNRIDFVDEFFNAGNRDVPHAWLLHINFGYPLVDEGTELCYDSPKIQTMAGSADSAAYFRLGAPYKRITAPANNPPHGKPVAAYLQPRPIDKTGRTTVGIVNRKLSLGVAVHYNTRELPRCANWQNLARHEYVTALEPCNGTADGRDKDRAAKMLDTLKVGQRKSYHYSIEVVTDRKSLDALRKLNR